MNARYYQREKLRLEYKIDILLRRIDQLVGLTPEEEILYCTELSKLYLQADASCSELEAVRYGEKYATSF